MDIRHLQTLVTAADADSFASAAEQLFITPAAVSQQIRQLESELGILLFDRTNRPPSLSSQGESLVERARELVELFNDFKATASAGRVRGQLSIGSITGIMVSLLPETLRSLSRRYPDVRIRIEEGSSRVLVRRIRRRELDAAIVSDVVNLDESMQRFPIFSEPLVVIEKQDQASPSWREALKRAPFIRLHRQSGLGGLIDDSLRKLRVRVDELMELDSTDSIVQMTLAGLGTGIVPMGRIAADAARGLNILPFGEPQIQRQVVMVQRTNSSALELTRLLYQELQSQIADRS